MQLERSPDGRFVTIEGPDGSGKSVQTERLVRRLQGAGLPAILTRQPGGTAVGERIRDIVLDSPELKPVPAADALLFNAARAQLVAEVIRPALAGGAIVVCDRHADSTLAYQGYGAGQSIEALRGLGRFANGDLRPDLTVLIDLPVEEGLRRKHSADEQNRFETGEALDFHRRVRDGFLALAAAEPDRFVIVDGCRSAEAIEAEILVALLPRLAPAHRERLAAIEINEPSAEPVRKGL